MVNEHTLRVARITENDAALPKGLNFPGDVTAAFTNTLDHFLVEPDVHFSRAIQRAGVPPLLSKFLAGT